MHIYRIKNIALIPEASVSNEAASASDCYGPEYNAGLCILNPAWHWGLAPKGTAGIGTTFQSKLNMDFSDRDVAEKKALKTGKIEVKVSVALKVS